MKKKKGVFEMAKSDMLLRKNLRENILKDITNYFTEKG